MIPTEKTWDAQYEDIGECPKCGSSVSNNAACGDPECCGPNYDYCTNDECGWEGALE